MLFPLSRKEKNILKFGVGLFLVQFLVIIVFSIIKSRLSIGIVTIIAATLIGGRMASIMAGLELGFSPEAIIIILFIFNLSWLSVVYPLFVSFHYHAVKSKFLGKLLKSTKRTADKEKAMVLSLGSWGIPLFVWLPFPWTGALVGSVIGFLVGIPTKRIIFYVVPSMFVGVASWVYGFKYIFLFSGTTGKIISLIVIVAFLAGHRLAVRKKENKNKTVDN